MWNRFIPDIFDIIEFVRCDYYILVDISVEYPCMTTTVCVSK